VLDCEIHDSIVDEESRIEDIDLAGALLGAHSQLTNGR
jgi:glucose-1-phosphate thymidylyltransferase